MIVTLVTYHCKPGKASAFWEAISAEQIPQLTAAEPGCQGYDYYWPIGKEDMLLLVERWPDEEALQRHCKYDHYLRLQEIKPEYVERVELEKFVN